MKSTFPNYFTKVLSYKNHEMKLPDEHISQVTCHTVRLMHNPLQRNLFHNTGRQLLSATPVYDACISGR